MSLGFIILRHVNSEKTNLYWIECYRCIRNFYPENKIVIIDDNSNYDYINSNDLAPLYNTEIIDSEYKKRGELLPYYYYLKFHFFDKAVILHDSVFIQQYFDFTNVQHFQFLWEFEHIFDNPEKEISKLECLDNNTKLIELYYKKEVWKGCFGVMSIVSYDFLQSIDEKHKLSNLLERVHTREDRSNLERVIAVIFEYNYLTYSRSLLGNIHNYTSLGYKYTNYTYDQYLINKLLLPIIKVFSGR